MALFGLSFGAKKTSGSSTKTLDKTVEQERLEEARRQEQQTQESLSRSISETTSFGDSRSQQQQQQTAQGQETTQQVGRTTAFSDTVLRQLEDTIGGLITGIGSSASSQASQRQAGQLGDFDLDSFINSSVAAAENRVNSQVNNSIGQLSSAVGGTAGTNSAVALLSQQLQGDAASAVEGVRANALLSGTNALSQGLSATSAASGQETDVINTILNALKGGVVETTQAGQRQTAQQSALAGSSGTQTMEQSTQQQAQQTQVVQDLVSLIATLLRGTERTTGTETEVTKGKQLGGGVSIGL